MVSLVYPHTMEISQNIANMFPKDSVVKQHVVGKPNLPMKPARLVFVESIY